MNLIIGPSGAWYALGFKGLCVYIIIITVTKFIVAESFSINERVSKIGYRISPIFLLLAGLSPWIMPRWETNVVIVPLLIGTYIGAFWNAFHGIRKIKKSNNERDSVKQFQFFEIFSTVIAAVLVISLKYLDLSSYAGYFGGLLALIALMIPMNIGTESIGMSTNNFSSEKAVFAKLITGSFGIIGFSTVWSMRIVALQYAGINGIAVMVAISSIVGFTFSTLNDSKFSPKDADERNWKNGNYLVIVGILLMGIGLFKSQHQYFLLGYLICKAGTSGILHQLEVRISGELLFGGGRSIGLRERIKFRTQNKIVVIYLVFNISILFLLGEINVFLLISFPLLISLLCCILNLQTINQLSVRQLV